jgi:hypothetical protein
MDKVAAIEVKATLQPDRWPRLAPVGMNQMTTQWLDKLGNAGMIATELQAADVYGLIAMVQFACRQLKAAITEDFVSYSPVKHRTARGPLTRSERQCLRPGALYQPHQR